MKGSPQSHRDSDNFFLKRCSFQVPLVQCCRCVIVLWGHNYTPQRNSTHGPPTFPISRLNAFRNARNRNWITVVISVEIWKANFAPSCLQLTEARRVAASFRPQGVPYPALRFGLASGNKPQQASTSNSHFISKEQGRRCCLLF